MDNRKEYLYLTAFILPIILLIIGFYILLKPIDVTSATKSPSSIAADSTNTSAKVEGKVDTAIVSCCGTVIVKEDSTKVDVSNASMQPDKAFQYFFLASVIFIVLLLLPKLKELTISKDSISIVLQDTLNKVDELQTQVQPEGIRMEAAVDVSNKVLNIKNNIELLRKMIDKK